MKKKFLLYLSIFTIIFLGGFSQVKADTLVLSSYTDYLDCQVQFYNDHNLDIENLIEIWETNFSMEYPYYMIKYITYSNDNYSISLTFSSDRFLTYYNDPSSSSSPYFNVSFSSNSRDQMIIYYSEGYDSSNPATCYKNHNSISDNCTSGFPINFTYYIASSGSESYSSLPLINNGFRFSDTDSAYSSLQFNGYSSSLYQDFIFQTFYVEDNNIMPSVISLYDSTYNPDISDSYTEIDLNDYDYVLLTLKNYNSISEQYPTTIYTKGSLCWTPVYNYGMTEKFKYYEGYQTQSCTDYYTDFTPVSVYILPQDVENHAVYYVKSSNTYVSNIIKVDSDLFNIFYVDSENSSNPTVIIDNRSYPVVPYDNLTDTAIISTEEGYISGQVCAIGDVNCMYNSSSMDISELFTKPLDVLQSVWTSITNVFVLITAFISLIPSPLREFLITSFMLAILLGILKIIIG